MYYDDIALAKQIAKANQDWHLKNGMRTWTYEQATGNLHNPYGVFVATGYAGGNCGKNPEGKNNPAMQGIRSIGPLPVGNYTFGTPVEGSHLGPFAIPLVPDPANDMLGRGGFYMHGDTTPSGNASEGCIIMARSIRNECYASPYHTIAVI